MSEYVTFEFFLVALLIFLQNSLEIGISTDNQILDIALLVLVNHANLFKIRCSPVTKMPRIKKGLDDKQIEVEVYLSRPLMLPVRTLFLCAGSFMPPGNRGGL